MPTGRRVSKLEDLRVNEVSGVDDPANLRPGFLVRKDAGQAAVQDPKLEQLIDAILKDADEFEKSAASLASALEDNLDVLEDAPPAVRRSAEGLRGWLKQGGGAEPGEAPADADEDAVEDGKKKAASTATDADKAGKPWEKDDDEEKDDEKKPASRRKSLAKKLAGILEGLGLVQTEEVEVDFTAEMTAFNEALTKSESERTEALTKAATDLLTKAKEAGMDLDALVKNMVAGVQDAIAKGKVEQVVEEPVTKTEEPSALEKAVTDLATATKAGFEALGTDLGVVKDALASGLDRVAVIEKAFGGSKALNGQEAPGATGGDEKDSAEKVEKNSGLEGAIAGLARAAAAGNSSKVTLS
jgi:hypothetical protein